MKINRHNYEAFLLDQMEGTLSREDQRELQEFLVKHPDLAVDQEAGIPWKLEAKTLSYPGKESLKKELPDSGTVPSESNFDLTSIARLEGDLTGEQERLHEALVNENSRLAAEWNTWQKLRLKAEPVEFSGKEQLKQKTGSGRRVLWITVLSSAAAVALLVTLLRMDFLSPPLETSREIALSDQGVDQPQPDTPPEITSSEPAEGGESVTTATSDKPEESVQKPQTPREKPAILTIRKHQEPPELTGGKQSKVKDITPDSDRVADPKKTAPPGP